MNASLNPTSGSIDRDFDTLTRSAADHADTAFDATHNALDSLQDKAEDLRDQAPGAISRAAARLDELQRRGIEAARKVGTKVQDQAVRTGERTVGYIKDEPVKSMLIAAAAGAAVAALISMGKRSRSYHR